MIHERNSLYMSIKCCFRVFYPNKKTAFEWAVNRKTFGVIYTLKITAQNKIIIYLPAPSISFPEKISASFSPESLSPS